MKLEVMIAEFSGCHICIFNFSLKLEVMIAEFSGCHICIFNFSLKLEVMIAEFSGCYICIFFRNSEENSYNLLLGSDNDVIINVFQSSISISNSKEFDHVVVCRSKVQILNWTMNSFWSTGSRTNVIYFILEYSFIHESCFC